MGNGYALIPRHIPEMDDIIRFWQLFLQLFKIQILPVRIAYHKN